VPLRPAWFQTSLRISSETDSEQHGSWTDCADAQAGLDPCWSRTHYVGFVMTQLKFHWHNNDTKIYVNFIAGFVLRHYIVLYSVYSRIRKTGDFYRKLRIFTFIDLFPSFSM
jgi:hypothetical protein